MCACVCNNVCVYYNCLKDYIGLWCDYVLYLIHVHSCMVHVHAKCVVYICVVC